MNYYPFHIGDYLARTAHLDPIEDIAYRRLIDLYYLREAQLPKDPEEVAKLIRMRSDVNVVRSVLKEFFSETDTGWAHQRCDYEISEAQSKRSKAQASAVKRWHSEGNADAMPPHSEGNAPNPNPNPNPKGKPKPLSDYPPEFDAAWSAYPSRPGASKKDAFRAWTARITSGVGHQIILDGVLRYAAYCEAMKTESKFIKQPTTFFGPADHFLSDWTIPTGGSHGKNGSSRASRTADTIAELTGANRRAGDASRVISGEATRLD